MRFRSAQNGIEVTVITSTSSILMSFHMDEKDQGANFKGFAIAEINPKTGKKEWFLTKKHFEKPNETPDKNGSYTTQKQPLQAFYWEDFTVRPGTDYTYEVYPVRGKERKLGKPCVLKVQSEPEKSGTHSVYFNRGVTGSFAYSKQFNNKKPADMSATELRKARLWMSRGLLEAMEAFLKKAKDNTWKIRGAVYEFEYGPILELLQQRADAGVDVKVVYDSRKEADANDHAIKEAKLKRKLVIRRATDPGLLSHNKFFILFKNDEPVEVWTGSTNITVKGIFGQCNTGHIVRDKTVAAQYFAYWKALSKDPDKNVMRAATDKIQPDLAAADIPPGVTCFFSPRQKITMANTYANLIRNAKEMVCCMFPFSFHEDIKAAVTEKSQAVKYVIVDKLSEDRRPEGYDMKHIKVVFGTFMEQPFMDWIKEVNSGILFHNNKAIGTNYIHNKVILIDPLSEDPIIITGSANYSKNSTQLNDENTMVIRGDKRLADLYFCEFNRIYNHYYSRHIANTFAVKAKKAGATPNDNHFILKEKASEWVPSFFDANNIKSIRRELFRKMKV
jgi:hypothetical protein